ncbi:MAG TPA: LytR C-terminal domain-containing protein [Sinomonas sp.]|nr:LytR C-terminal domain-containing protein [Sinomonas sp.]
MSTYPRDEFDDVPESPRRQGVHRSKATVESSRRGLALVFAVAAVVVLGLLGAFFIGPKFMNQTAASSPTTSSQKASATGSTTPTQSATQTPTTASSAPPATSSEAPTSSAPTPSAPAGADHSLAVGVYNATTTAGLGNRVATTARTAGWSVAAVGNWSGTPVSTSVVFYRDASQKASADALAADLGIGTVLQAQQLGYPLAAVIGPGYTG